MLEDLTKSIQDFLQFEDFAGPILRMLRETQRHFNINIFTWFKLSMKKCTEDIAFLTSIQGESPK